MTHPCRDEFIAMFLCRLARLLAIRSRLNEQEVLLRIVEWGIYSSREDLKALGALDEADRLIWRQG